MVPQGMNSAPIAIGGLGGSGTRVFAALLQAAGVRMGDCLNPSLDNLWFAVLFKRAQWCAPANPQRFDPADVRLSIDLFLRAMTKGLAAGVTPSEQGLLARLRADLPPFGTWQCGPQAAHVDSLIASTVSVDVAGQPWGWKEPNTHIFLPDLDRHISGFRYIHVVRNGLDMAFSNNTWQARHWAYLFGLAQGEETPLPLHQLRYWAAANQAALDYGQRHMAGRFLAVDYEDFCARPEQHWQRIQHFLGEGGEQPLPAGLVRPSTIGRSAAHDLSVFPQADLDKARALQNTIETIGQPKGSAIRKDHR